MAAGGGGEVDVAAATLEIETAKIDGSITWSPDARAALLRDASGEIVGTTWGGTICWFPRRPSRFSAIAEDGSEHVLRCGFCPGCREFDRRRLAARLREHYREYQGELWIVIVRAPLELHARIAAGVHRSALYKAGVERTRPHPPCGHLPEGEGVSGFYRLGSHAIAFLFKGAKPRISRSKIFRRYQTSVHRIRRSRGLRAFALVTAGMLRPRDDYGEQTNRFYHRGLPARAHEHTWSVETRRPIQGRRAVGEFGAPRAWRDGITIHPPKVWKLPRLLHRKGPERRRTARPVAAAAVLDTLIASFLGGAVPAGAIPIAAAPKAPLPPSSFSGASRAGLKGAVDAGPLHGAGRASGRAVLSSDLPPHNTGPSILEGPGYRSSLHSGRSPAARAAPDPGAATRKFFREALERLNRLAKEREEKGEK